MLIVNNTEVENVFYDGIDLDQVIYNGVVVFEKNKLDVFDPDIELIDFTYYKHKNYYILTGWKGTYQGEPSTSCVMPDYNSIKLHNDEKIFSLDKKDYLMQIEKQTKIQILAFNFSDADFERLSIQVKDNNNIIEYNNFELKEINFYTTQISLNITSVKLGQSIIDIMMSIDNVTLSEKINVEVVELLPVSYEVVPIDGYYPFELNASGYYESTNKGVDDSCALCEVIITNSTGANVYIDCVNNGGINFDYGLLSKVNEYPLNNDYNRIKSDAIYYSFEDSSETSYPIKYGAVEGSVYILYKKDFARDVDNDSLQFKVRFEE